LLDEVRDVARRFALAPREIVAANKMAMNRIADMNGFRNAVAQLADIDVIAHRSAVAAAAGARLTAAGPGAVSRQLARVIQDPDTSGVRPQ
jgi:enoyl-CoA hydratase